MWSNDVAAPHATATTRRTDDVHSRESGQVGGGVRHAAWV